MRHAHVLARDIFIFITTTGRILSGGSFHKTLYNKDSTSVTEMFSRTAEVIYFASCGRIFFCENKNILPLPADERWKLKLSLWYKVTKSAKKRHFHLDWKILIKINKGMYLNSDGVIKYTLYAKCPFTWTNGLTYRIRMLYVNSPVVYICNLMYFS